ncbi:MAG: cytochrome c oxidase assembly protein [Actinomycetota bacterium]
MELTLSDIGWQAHPEVWLLVIGIAVLAGYVWRVVQPKAVAAGYEPITGRQRLWFLLGLVGLWVASDWPVHDVAEEYLYFVHMAQHLFISMIIPLLFLLSMPRWLFDLLFPRDGAAYRFLRRASRPIVAGLVFNALTLVLHWPNVVQASFDSGPIHFILHLLVFAAGLLMWMPVVGPVRSWRLSPIGQCIFLFMMSIVPTVPSGWLVFAEDVAYRHYDTADRLWGVGVLTDQQAAGVVMKLVGGFFLWAVIVVIFARWAIAEGEAEAEARRARGRALVAAADRAAAEAGNLDDGGPEGQADRTADRGPDGRPLTFESVAEEFARTEAPAEPRP